MQNHKQQDSLSINKISSSNEIKAVAKKVGNAAEDPFCVYAHKRHAVGSKIENPAGMDSVCKDDGSWHNTK